jgi:hypothetical protein
MSGGRQYLLWLFATFLLLWICLLPWLLLWLGPSTALERLCLLLLLLRGWLWCWHQHLLNLLHDVHVLVCSVSFETV